MSTDRGFACAVRRRCGRLQSAEHKLGFVLSRWLSLGLLLLVVNHPYSALAQGGISMPPAIKHSGFLCFHGCDSTKVKKYDLKDQNYAGEIIRGPRTIVVYNLNPLRYKYSINSNISFSQPADLWSKLAGIASPQSPSATPTAPSPKKALQTEALPGAAARDQASKPGGATSLVKGVQPTSKPGRTQQTALPISQQTLDMVQKATAAIADGKSAIEAVKQQSSGIDQSLKNSLTQDFHEVSVQAANANSAMTNVASGGQELLSFLKAIDATNTYSRVQNELSANSQFIKGVSAHWADAASVTTLKSSNVIRKATLNAKKASFEAAYPSLLKSLGAAQHDLIVVQGNLQMQKSTLQAAPRSAVEQTLVSDTIDSVSRVLNGGKDTDGDDIEGVNTSAADFQRTADILNWAIAQNASIDATLGDLDATGDKYKAFQQAQATLFDWQQRMLSLKESWENHQNAGGLDPFVLKIPGTCDYSFSTTKQTVIKVTALDQLPDKSAAAPSDVLSVTVECASPFTVSAGVAFSSISDHQFSIQPVATPVGSTTTTNEFVLISNSSFHPLPLGIVSARLYEPSEAISFHLSLGLAGDFKSQNAGGSGADFLVGPSIALFRTMFLTAGLHLGQKVSLGDGFRVGDPVPSNVTSPPLQKSYTPAFGFAITFTKP